MSDFVEECRREWKKLGVPDGVADEMARELAADLEEAESEGGSAADVLGSAALDPRSFAASWATERGVARPGPNGAGLRRRSFALAAFVTLAVFVMIGASLGILAWDSSPQLSRVQLLPPPFSEPPPGRTVVIDPVRVARMDPIDDPGSNIDPIGWTLLIVGVVGIVPALLLWSSWARARPPVAPT